MQELRLDQVVERISEAIRDENLKLAHELLWPALNQKPDVGPLYFYAGILSSFEGRDAVAYQMFRRSHELEPHPANWANLGGVLRSMGRVEESREILRKGLDHAEKPVEIYANLCGSYVNEGDPWPGIEYGEKALALKADHGGAKFNLALLYLEAGEYARGFDYYADGAHRHRIEKTYQPDPPELTPELHERLKGHGKRLIVWAEQGIGDEIMFSTILREAKRDYEIHFECHARLETMFQHAAWMKSAGYPITLYPTRKIHGDETVSGLRGDAKLALGNLGRLYRRTPESFAWTGPVLSADPKEARQMRGYLETIAAGRKIIGLALRGGTMSTARTYRMLPPQVLTNLLSDPRYLFVSLDYEDVTALGDYIAKEHGTGRFLWYPSINWAWDYQHQAALVKATDAVVTVCQSVAHLSAAMGHPTYVLTPSRPAWRYGLTGETWNWYPHPAARLLRQHGSDWGPPVSILSEALQARFFADKSEAA
jgi:tetratricopeptide (TPR) repeat protein